MSSRLAEKQRRRAEREARERQLAAGERDTRRLRLTGAVALAAVGLVGVAALTTLGNSGNERLPAGSERAFGQHYAGIEQRRVAAGVSTMAAPSANEHTHPRLAVWANGQRVPVPADIGIDPRNDPGQMAGLHTHDDSGTIHTEGQADATLGQFFAVWGVPFSEDRLGPYRAGNGGVVQLWVDGKPSTAFGALGLADGQDIRIAFGPKRATPPAA
ncbi:MAG: hypothetical protein ACRDPC_03315 [Solirubrobacteraceae bacterium]